MTNLSRRKFVQVSFAGLSAAGVNASLLEAAEATSGGGQVQYNGIRLPTPWPPQPSTPTPKPAPLPPHLATPPVVIPIDVGRQLFVDDFLVEATTLTRTFHQPVWHSANPILQPDQTWEKLGPSPMASAFSDGVWWDPRDRLFKLWYMAGYRRATALAVSEDGVKWQKRDWGIVPGTSIVHTSDRDSANVWLDLDEPDPQRRYKLFRAHREEINGRGEWSFEIHLSADGVHWGPVAGRSNGIYPRSTVFYNPFRRVWVFGLRKDSSTVIGRCRRYYECKNGVKDAAKNPEERSWWVGADSLDPARPDTLLAPQLTNLDCVAYESLLLGHYTLWRGKADPATGRPELNDVCLGYSRDGFHFTRPDRRPFLALSERKGDWNWGNVQSAGAGCLIVGDQLYFYASGRRGGLADFPDGDGCTGLATLRRDGFASFDAEIEGTLTTRPVRFTGQHLFVNLAAPSGELRVEILDEDGTALAPFTSANCAPLKGDATKLAVRWQDANDLKALTGKAVKFRFTLRRGKLFSFWVSPEPSGMSRGYVAGGGPGFTKSADV